MEEITEIEISNKLNYNSPPKAGTGPWLVFMWRYNKISNEKCQTLYSIPEKECCYLNKMDDDDVQGCKIWPTSQGNWMLTQESKSRKYCLWNPLTSQKVFLPNYKLNFRGYDRCAISSSPLDPNCKLICLHGNCLSFFDFKTNKWSRHDIEEEDKIIRPWLVALNGNFYCVTTISSRLAVIDFSHHSKIRILEEMPGNVWPLGSGFQCHQYLLESCEELFFVQGFSRLTENSNIAHWVVFKRDCSNEEWNAVDNIGDRVFFFGRRHFAASWSASELNVKGNCIYYLLDNKSCLYKFDMTEGTIQVDAPCREALCLKSEMLSGR